MKRKKVRRSMSKSTYHIKETKDSYSFSYSGDLKEALEKALKDAKAGQLVVLGENYQHY
jgi:hypothetical protein